MAFYLQFRRKLRIKHALWVCLGVAHVCFTTSYAQDNFYPTKRHLKKVENQTNSSRKLALYRKYFRKDSIRYIKQTEQYWKAKTDSLTKQIQKRDKAIARRGKAIKDGVNTKVYNTVYKPWARKQAEEQLRWLSSNGIKISPSLSAVIFTYFQDYFLKASQDAELLFQLKQQVPDLPLPKQLTSKVKDFELINPEKARLIQSLVKEKSGNLSGIANIQSATLQIKKYQGKIGTYSQYGKLLRDADSLKGFARTQSEEITMDYLSKTPEYAQVDELKKYQGELDNLKGMPGKYRTKGEQLQDSAYLKTEAKRKAEELADEVRERTSGNIGRCSKEDEQIDEKIFGGAKLERSEHRH